MRPAIALVFALMLGPVAAGADSPWLFQPSGTTERLRGVAAVDDRTVWASGNHATCVRSTDGGASWAKVEAPADAANLDFRDVEAADGERAYVLAIGPGAASRVFKATHHGTALVECYRNPDPRGFLDAIAFWDHDHGLALGDPVDGRFVILGTDDAGRSWEQRSEAGTMPPALANEGAFAASGTCLVVGEGGQAWFATGGATKARVFRSRDRGRSWTVAETAMLAGEPSRGIFGLAFRGESGFAVGGDYRKPDGPGNSHPAMTADGGATWPLVTREPPGHPGATWPFRSAVAFLHSSTGDQCLAVGPSGTDVTHAHGFDVWRPLSGAEGFHALAVAPSGRFVWAVGEGGRVGRLAVADVVPPPAPAP